GHDQNIDSLEGYEPPQCLWSLVKQHVPELELPEIRAVLGEALVDLYTEMYAEHLHKHLHLPAIQASVSRDLQRSNRKKRRTFEEARFTRPDLARLSFGRACSLVAHCSNKTRWLARGREDRVRGSAAVPVAFIDDAVRKVLRSLRWFKPLLSKTGRLLRNTVFDFPAAAVEMWRQVWREARGKQGFGSRTPQPALADPPAIKELLRDEIRLLLLAVRDVANGEGRRRRHYTVRGLAFLPSVWSFFPARSCTKQETVHSVPPEKAFVEEMELGVAMAMAMRHLITGS
ncbi:hypothetical protein Z043_103560, partial [Scleropages formosus]